VRIGGVAITIGALDALPLWAAEHGGEHATAHEGHEAGDAHTPSVTELLFPAINFAIFAVILVKYVIPALREYLRRRADEVTTLATESRTALSEAEALIAATRARMTGVGAEREAIRRDLVDSATRHAERTLAQAEDTGKRRLADAALVAEQERRRALHDVRAEIAALATDVAESRLRATLSADDQRGFVREFLKEAPTR
jgi:F-type H+-transporting ATPase subunit b